MIFESVECRCHPSEMGLVHSSILISENNRILSYHLEEIQEMTALQYSVLNTKSLHHSRIVYRIFCRCPQYGASRNHERGRLSLDETCFSSDERRPNQTQVFHRPSQYNRGGFPSALWTAIAVAQEVNRAHPPKDRPGNQKCHQRVSSCNH